MIHYLFTLSSAFPEYIIGRSPNPYSSAINTRWSPLTPLQSTYYKHCVVNNALGGEVSRHETPEESVEKGTFQDTQRKGNKQSGIGVCGGGSSGMVEGANITFVFRLHNSGIQEEMPESRRSLSDLVFSFHLRLQKWRECFFFCLSQKGTFLIYGKEILCRPFKLDIKLSLNVWKEERGGVATLRAVCMEKLRVKRDWQWIKTSKYVNYLVIKMISI